MSNQAGREGVPEAGQTVGLPLDDLPQLGEAGAVRTVRGYKGSDLRELLPQTPAVDIKGMELDLIQHHYYRGVAAKALDQVQPVVGVVLFLTLAAVEHQQVEAAPGQEKLVGGVHDLLAAEVPNMEPNRTHRRGGSAATG